MDFEDIEKLLEISKRLIQGENHEKNINRLNAFIKYAVDAWLLVDPVTGTVAKGAKVAITALDDLFNGLKDAAQEDIDTIFNEILNKHNDEIKSLRAIVDKLIPKASVSYKQGGFSIINGHGICGVTDYSNNKFSLNFDVRLEDSDEYMALCNVSGTYTDVTNEGVDVVLPESWSQASAFPIKVVVIRILY